jgi:hypothetical protein
MLDIENRNCAKINFQIEKSYFEKQACFQVNSGHESAIEHGLMVTRSKHIGQWLLKQKY